jgi:polar amino acid transport system substrate-binding protein
LGNPARGAAGLRIRWVLAVAALASAPGSSRAEDLELKVPGTLRVIVGTDDLPALFVADRPEGLEREMLEGFARLHGLRIQTVKAHRQDRIPWLLEDKGDIVAGGMAMTPERRKLVAFTAETFPVRHAAVTRRPHAPVDTLEQLRQERVGVHLKSSGAEEALAAGVPRANLDDSFTSYEEILVALKAGRISCSVMSVIGAMSDRRKDPALQIGLMIGTPTGTGFALRKEQPRLLKALNDYVVATRRTATWNRLVVKYLGEDALDVLKRSREIAP